jgi:DNA-directed RNA polymerase II subunit RPB1
MTRLLTNEEIENMIAFIQPQKGIPVDTALSITNIQKEKLRVQLRKQKIYPEIIPALKDEIEKSYYACLIDPGDSVGVISAQSIGEKQTQTTLNTFHRAGQSEKTMTAGVPRFQELLNATKNPRIVNHKIFFQRGNDSIQEMRNTVGSSIVGMTMADISKSIKVELNKESEPWYEAHKILFSDEFSSYTHCITFNLDMKKLFEFKLTMQQIADHIHEEYSDLYCVFSPPAEGQLDVFVDTKNIRLPEARLLFVDQDNAVLIYLEEVVQATLEQIYICGIPAISEVFYLKEGSEWIVETNGFCSNTISKQYSSFKRLLAHPDVDYTRTVSNNVWDIYDVLDIEAARQFLIEEFMSIMEGINTCHAMILVDRMTHNGTISSITRYTMKKEESGPMGKASFEETMDNFLNAAAEGDKEPTEGVSASIICGKRASIGTGMIKMSIDIAKLPKGVNANIYSKQPPVKTIPANVMNQVIEKSPIIIGKEEDDDDYEIPAFEQDGE